MSESLPIDKVQLGAETGAESLLTPTPLHIALGHYLVSCRVEGKSLRTIEAYRYAIGGFADFAHIHHLPVELAKVTTGDVRLFLLSLQERNLSPPTVSQHYRGLNTFFNWLVSEGQVDKNPMANIRPPKVPRVLIWPFSRADIDSLLVVCSGQKFLDVRNRAVALVLLDTALRLAELAAVQLADIDLGQDTIRVMGKGAKGRLVRVGKTTQKALLKYLLARKDPHPCLWVTEERQPLTRRGMKTAVRRLCEYAEIKGPKLGSHTFRHTAAINYLRNGGDVFTLQVMLGHSTLEMTRRYVAALGAEDMIRVHQKASPVDNLGLG